MNSADAGILRLLRAALRHMPREELSGQLGVTPEIIPARIAELQAAGYDIEEHPHFGYRLLSAPDRLIADDLSGMLEGVPLVREILVFEKTGSTNDVAARMGREGAAGGLVIFAEEQTAGRGRLGRRWESDPRRGLWFSLLLRPRFPLAHWSRITTWAAVAVAGAIEETVSCHAAIKWPNDIYIEGKKVTGILVESHFDREQEGFAVLGIGVNVNQQAFPADLSDKATSLHLAVGGPLLNRQEIAAAILQRLDALYPKLENDFAAIVSAAEARSFLRGKWIQVAVGGNVIEGMADRLDGEGGLVLHLRDGGQTTVSSGEATLKVGAS